jgi:hypothetical protein
MDMIDVVAIAWHPIRNALMVLTADAVFRVHAGDHSRLFYNEHWKLKSIAVSKKSRAFYFFDECSRRILFCNDRGELLKFFHSEQTIRNIELSVDESCIFALQDKWLIRLVISEVNSSTSHLQVGVYGLPVINWPIFSYPVDLVASPDGRHVYVTDRFTNLGDVVKKVTIESGSISIVFNQSTTLNRLHGLAIDGAGNIIVCDDDRVIYLEIQSGNYTTIYRAPRPIRTITIDCDGFLYHPDITESTVGYRVVYFTPQIVPPYTRRSVRQALRLARLLWRPIQSGSSDVTWAVLRSVIQTTLDEWKRPTLDDIVRVALDRSTLGGTRSRLLLAQASRK